MVLEQIEKKLTMGGFLTLNFRFSLSLIKKLCNFVV